MPSPSVNRSSGTNLWAQLKQRQQSQPISKQTGVKSTAGPDTAKQTAETKRKSLASKAKTQQMKARFASVTDKVEKKQHIATQLKAIQSSQVTDNAQEFGSQLAEVGKSGSETGKFIGSLGKDSTLKVNQGGLAAELQKAKQGLKKVSQHQVLNLGDMSSGTTTKESTISRKMGTEVGGIGFDRDLFKGAESTLDIVGHSSDGGMKIEGKSPELLAKLLSQKIPKNGDGKQQVKKINLVSCGSEQFISEFKGELSKLGVEVGEVTGAKGRVAVDRTTGQTLDEAVVGDLGKIDGHDGGLGLTESIKNLAREADVPEESARQYLADPVANNNDKISSYIGNLASTVGVSDEVVIEMIKDPQKHSNHPLQKYKDANKSVQEYLSPAEDNDDTVLTTVQQQQVELTHQQVGVTDVPAMQQTVQRPVTRAQRDFSPEEQNVFKELTQAMGVNGEYEPIDVVWCDSKAELINCHQNTFEDGDDTNMSIPIFAKAPSSAQDVISRANGNTIAVCFNASGEVSHTAKQEGDGQFIQVAHSGDQYFETPDGGSKLAYIIYRTSEQTLKDASTVLIHDPPGNPITDNDWNKVHRK